MVVGEVGPRALVTMRLLQLQGVSDSISAIQAAAEPASYRSPSSASSALVSIWGSGGQGNDAPIADAMLAYGAT